MTVWLYQMTLDHYSPAKYRAEVIEGKLIDYFESGKISSKSKATPQPLDLVFFFFTPSGKLNPDPGIYGWGVISGHIGNPKKISFTPTAPSDVLKLHPLWNPAVKASVDRIRGPVKQGTMWEVESNDWVEIQRAVAGLFPLGTWPKSIRK